MVEDSGTKQCYMSAGDLTLQLVVVVVVYLSLRSNKMKKLFTGPHTIFFLSKTDIVGVSHIERHQCELQCHKAKSSIHTLSQCLELTINTYQ